jgi:hypothetical protein
MTKRISIRKVKHGIGKTMTFLLVTLYVAGTSHLELLHSYFHEHDILVTHSEQQEKDPCHRLIYHNDGAQGCHHDSHLTASEKCQTCDLVYHPHKTILSNTYFELRQFANSYFEFYKLSLDSYWSVISSSRAPPTVC